MTKTLFSRYKDMINNKWAAGKRAYTASELNQFVGQYENPTMWKRCTNNHFYATRTYQTLLKDFGCITMIKRGLWQINAPIPEWFGSFHFNGLKGGFDLSNPRGDHGCIYWKALPAHQKVNPWKNIDPMRVIASTNPADDCTTIHAKIEVVEECAVYTISGIPVTSKIPGLTATYNLNVWREKSGVVAAELTDWTFYLDGAYTPEGSELLSLIGETHTSAAAIAKKRAIDAYNADRKGQPTRKMYTEAQVMQILKEYNQDLRTYIDRAFDLSDNTPFFTLHDLSEYDDLFE
jgi:hypothetical protein